MINKVNKENREASIRLWFSRGLSQVEIAEKLEVTRQRVQQIEAGLGISRERIYKKKEYTLKCATCKKKFVTNKLGRKYCSRECFRKSRIKNLTIKQKMERDILRKEKNRVKAREYYHNVFKKQANWKFIVKERNKKQHATQSTNKA